MKYTRSSAIPMFPLQAWSGNAASLRSSPSEASANTDPVAFSFDTTWDGGSPISTPAAPPPTPQDSLLDITPRKCSFSTAFGMSNACAFPSWPNRPALISTDTEVSTGSAYISDEELCFDLGPQSESAVEEESAVEDAVRPGDLTTEQQIQMLRAAAEEEAQRARFLAQVQAHARAQQAMRVAQLASQEKENAKRKKRQAMPQKKRRAPSATKVVIRA
ncbi:hypothetical protein F9C07_9163 [Aspergillus flavus]|uniref:Uncharacterized protein n=6 Tax=Aspergillus subgen. Circumdati TaxID=2720871 RepID=B8NM46_ASPFN|nr:uncharacterized protein G4B84_008744 [Aspergillus flavus NRRL3357]EIT79564.1 hypothetical protein Ao3042_04065 [Aspergillus oryzae 3.042]KAB8251006.1 hypothetical protein BDV35DRAFT_22100 [Aspergillus flavus]KDE84965.1 hypothetical protein AO1008_00296 [Aspergillus oryzae 100-8]KJJ34893.1 hypothetical protein AFLA70_265g001490 [Aspergillus flavus AF70]OOO05279.1 hypothetical protein OAory_01067950 [Aspergillus oryzae]GMG50446.1 unnamed protein product [Aspergillus oryzae var. brunneus]|eukprot:EIT79564.1 hypothetical protein Ao3042_04065 [Aspergillus oryzae 3.042]